ncbi:MAG: 50S ribosomal protein L24 [Mycoplasmataceae bacterium]|nr:MAG: 50S ribosomal protein L24 [Mycoplasmataceae bacterium]
MAKFNLKTGNTVKVICGKYRQTLDVIKKIDRKNGVVYLEKADRIKFVKDSKSVDKNKTKRIFVPIDISNVTLWEEK